MTGTDDHALRGLASDVRTATFRLARRLRNERVADELSDGQFAVLGALARYGPHPLGALADREHVTAPSMHRTVTCLADLGYVARAADEEDGRRVIVSLTASGRTLVEATVARRDAWLEAGLESLSVRDRDAVARALPILRAMADR